MPEVSGGLQYWQPASRLSKAPMADVTNGPDQKRKQERRPSYWRKNNRKGRGGTGRKKPCGRNNAARRKLLTPLNHVKNVANKRACAYRPTADH